MLPSGSYKKKKTQNNKNKERTWHLLPMLQMSSEDSPKVCQGGKVCVLGQRGWTRGCGQLFFYFPSYYSVFI